MQRKSMKLPPRFGLYEILMMRLTYPSRHIFYT